MTDALGQLTAVLLPAVTANGQSARPTTHYTYDVYGNLATESDPLAQQHYDMGGPPTWAPTISSTYDAFGRKTSETLATLADGTTPTETWAYNGLGQLASSTDFDGNLTDDTYDTQGRLATKAAYAKGSTTAYDTVTYTYDTPDPDGDGGHSDTVSSTLSGTTTSDYDVHGNLVKLATPQGTIRYTYDPATGAKKGVTTANTDILYNYNDLGQLTKVTADRLDGQAASQVTTYTYDAAGNLKTTTLPNGTVETRTYGALNRLASISTTVGANGPIVFSASYARDADGRITVARENQGGTAHEYNYAYDADGRLLKETIDPNSSSPRTLSYAYDLAGNRVASTDSGAPSAQQYLSDTYDADGRLTAIQGAYGGSGGPGYSVSSTYDAAGNTTTITTGSQVVTNTWDPEGHLVGVVTTVNGATTQTVSYTYDAAGNRTSETVNGQTTTYLNDPNQAYDQALEEYAPGGALAATYVRGLDLLFQDRPVTGSVPVRSFYVVDGLGSTRALTDANGAVTDTYTYSAYGDLTGSTGSTTNEFLYAGYQHDAATGLEYLRARYYDAAAGRFTSRDSYDGSTSDPITQNHYAYANADPVNVVDPTGHDGDLISTNLAVTIGTRIQLFVLQVAPTATKVVNFFFEVVTGETVYAGVAGVTAAGASGALQRIIGGAGAWLNAALRLRGTGLKVGPYGFFKGLGKLGEEANHLNQAKAYPVIPYNDGVSLALQGGVQQNGSLHRLFHESLEAFFNQYRAGGSRFGGRPTNAQYDAAMRKALDAVGVLPDEIDVLANLAERSRRYWGYFDGPGGKLPELPGRMNGL